MDANGSLTDKGNDRFGYDAANRLTSATVGQATASYSYDGAGKPTSETIGGATTRNTYDVNRSLPVLLQDGERTYVWGLGLAYAVDNAGGAVRVYHTDGLGSVRALTDANGAVVQTLSTDEFGVPTRTQGAGSQPFGYTGERRDAESGLQYLRARMYDPQLGRLLQRDPLPGHTASPQSLNRYAYVHNNPATFTDPSGLCIDPGGPGVRYCVDRFIPQQSIAGAEGDNRGADDGSINPANTFRIRQLVSPNPDGTIGYQQIAGESRGLGQEAVGTLERCGASVSASSVLKASRLVVRCQGSNGLVPTNFGPAIKTEVIIQETETGAAVVAGGTPFPSLEVWRYDDNGSKLIFYFDAVVAGTNPVTDLFFETRLPNHAP